MMFAKAEQQRYNWVEMNQRQLRMDLYKNVVDHVGSSDVTIQDIGRKVILPATHIGSPRDMLSRFQDAMAVIREKGKPSLFITMTCNPNWKEIQDQLLEGQKPEDRPDLEARVFKMKFDETNG